MRILRGSEGEMAVVDEAGHAVLELVPLVAAGPELEAVLERLAIALNPSLGSRPRVVVCAREGLTEQAAADIACELIQIDDDPCDDPPRSLRRYALTADPSAVAALLAR